MQAVAPDAAGYPDPTTNCQICNGVTTAYWLRVYDLRAPPQQTWYLCHACGDLLQLGFRTYHPRERLPGAAASSTRLLSSTQVEGYVRLGLHLAKSETFRIGEVVDRLNAALEHDIHPAVI